MSRLGWSTLGLLALLAMALAVASAQTPIPVRSLTPIKAKGGSDVAKREIPEGYLPPAGMCRIWIDNVPPDQQPAPTDCPSAIKNRPSNGRVVFPEDGARPRREEKGERDTKEKERKPRKPSE